jgi:type I restriction enzyme, S subunit
MTVWDTKPLSDVSSVFNGKTPAKTEQREFGHPVLKIKDVTENGGFRGRFESFVDPEFAKQFSVAKIAAGDTLILNAAHNAAYVASKTYQAEARTAGAIATGEWLIIRADKNALNPDYLNHWINNSGTRGALHRLVKGIHLYPKDVAQLRIPLPSLAEQRTIAAILNQANALRAIRRATVTNLETLKRSVFLDMFGEPGENPRRWPVVPVADYVQDFQGGKSMEAESGDHVVTRNRVLKISAVTGGKFLGDESKPIPDTYRPPSAHFVQAGDLLFSRANTTDLVGAVAYVESSPPNLLLPDKLWRFVWRRPATVEPLFVWALFQTAAIRREIGRRATGTSGSMKNISQAKVLGIRTIVPPLALQHEFSQRLQVIERLRRSQIASHLALDSLFAELQHRAFRGEL